MSDWLEEAQKSSKDDKPSQQTSPAGDSAQAPGGDWLDNALDKTATAAEGFVSAIPGGSLVARKGQQLLEKIEGLPADEQAIARQQADREKRNPVTHLAGTAAGFVNGALVLPGAGATTLAGKAAAAATTAALLTPAYKLGEVADQAALKNTPISVEQIHQAFSFDDILSAAGLTATLDVALHGAARGVSKLAPLLEERAGAQAAKLFKKAPEKTGLSAEALGQKALNEGLFTLEDAKAKLAEVSKRFDALKGSVDSSAGDLVARNLAVRLAEHADAHAQFSLGAPRKYVERMAKQLSSTDNTWDGAALHREINLLASETRAIRAPGARQFMEDALELSREEFAKGLETVDPQAGQAWRSALNDWKIYFNMARDLKSAPRQMGGIDLAAKAARTIPTLTGMKLAGPAGGLAGFVAERSLESMGVIPKATRTNAARLYQQFAQVAPGANFEAKAKEAIDFLLKPGTAMVAKGPADDLHERYETVSKALQACAANPDGAAENLRESLDWLPQQHADAVVAKAINTLQEHAVETQSQTGTNTAFGYHTVKTDREKRETLRKIEAAHDVFYAVKTGRADLFQVAAKHNPETARELQKRVMNELSTRQDVPFSTKRRVAAMLGVAGTPTQDPIVGGRLQQIIATKRQQQTAQGQVESTRNKMAGIKKDMESATRVQNLMDLGGKD